MEAGGPAGFSSLVSATGSVVSRPEPPESCLSPVQGGYYKDGEQMLRTFAAVSRGGGIPACDQGACVTAQGTSHPV